jgi:hypothetical protein
MPDRFDASSTRPQANGLRRRKGHTPMKTSTIALAALAATLASTALGQSVTPAVNNWIRNTGSQTGFNGLPANVTLLRHSVNFVYPSSAGIPLYTIGPWPGNPNTPANQNWVFKITKNPVVATTQTSTPLGVIGVLVNGVPFFNALDAMSYNNLNIWHRNAMYWEAASFDSCKGHPAPGGVYHPHQFPACVAPTNPQQHSAIIGFAFDGFPIYGPYGYANADGTGGIARMRTSYRTRAITQRTTLPDGTQLQPSQYGPAVSTQYPIGCFVEDYEYVAGLGDLDASNARFSVTPEYPNGTWCYFSTISAKGVTEYPYLVGPKYKGVLVAGNTGPGGGHVTPTDSPVTFTGSACAADIDFNRIVNAADLATLLSRWASGGGAGDLDRNGDVNGADLAILLSSWGSCP